MKNLPGKAGKVCLLLSLLISGSIFPAYSIASDRDVEPYMIYVDPVTGKYTTTRPGHESTDKTQPAETTAVSSVVNEPRAEIAPVLLISGAILLLSQLIALLFTKFSNKATNDY